MSDKKTDAPEEEGSAKGGKKKLILILAVLLIAGGAGAYFFLFSGSGTPAPPEPGTVLTLDPVAVNLAGGGYLKVGVALQFTTDAPAEPKPDGSKATDLIISTFSGAKPGDVSGARDALKKALQQKIIKAYDGAVMEIFYTQYVTQ